MPLSMNALLFLLLVATLFQYPYYPTFSLDSSWSMALGHFFREGLQFGPEVTFTFGPLGFLFGPTYMGLHFWSLMLWQALSTAVFAFVVIASARPLMGVRRVLYFGFFLLLGTAYYPDALYLMIVVLIGFEVIRRTREGRPLFACLLVALLALFATMKFTLLMLASFSLLVAGLRALVRGHRSQAPLLPSCFVIVYLALWAASGQHLSNLPVYLHNSWQLSQGYQYAMGLPTPMQPFWPAVTALFALSAYALLHLILNLGRPCTVSRFSLLAAFIFLIWKQGIVRSDGHMLLFFVAALLPAVAFPALLDDPPRRRWAPQLCLLLVGLSCLWGLHSLSAAFGWPDTIWQAPSNLQARLWRLSDPLRHWTSFRASYERQLEHERRRYDLPRTRALIGQAAIDVLGYDQAIALYNRLTYRPRPVFQSYSAYTPQLARLNDAFYRSSRAPQYVLLKLQTIDNRFLPLDDSLVLRSITRRYEYVHTERGFQLWRQRVQLPREGDQLAPRLRSERVTLNHPVELRELENTPLWATVRLQLSWLGELRSFVYKPPIVRLAIEDTQGRPATFRLTPPQAAAGFILNPLIQNSADYLCFTMGAANRRVHALTLEVPQTDLKFFDEVASLELSELPPTSSGRDCRALYMSTQFWMFHSYPINYEAPVPPSETQIDGRAAIGMHAPSTIEFAVPGRATTASGAFGFVADAYSGNGHTDGATFRVLWTDRQQRVELYRRHLDPRSVPGDRGLQDFHVDLQRFAGGQLLLQVDPGPSNDWDWTAWTGITID